MLPSAAEITKQSTTAKTEPSTATKDKTTVKVGADAAAAAVNTDGKTTHYTTVDEALAANSETAAEPVEIFVMADSEMAPEGLAHKNIKITTAPGVELEVFSDVSGMIVKATENADGTTNPMNWLTKTISSSMAAI